MTGIFLFKDSFAFEVFIRIDRAGEEVVCTSTVIDPQDGGEQKWKQTIVQSWKLGVLHRAPLESKKEQETTTIH